MKKHFGKLPVNSRIFIDYKTKDGKPKVKFGYPIKKAGLNEASGVILLVFLVLSVIFIYLLGNFAYHRWNSLPPKDCIISKGYNQTNIKNITIYCDNGYLATYEYIDGINNFILYDFSNKFIRVIEHPYKMIFYGFIFFVFIIIIFAMVMLLGYMFQKKCKLVHKMIPYENRYLSGRAYNIIFTEVPDNKIIEIPLFRNIFLDYTATKEFSKCLESFRIIEHPFSKQVFQKGKPVGKKKKNVYLWKAQFFFSDIPKTGNLEVRFK